MTDRPQNRLPTLTSAVAFGIAFFVCAELGRQISGPAFPRVTFWLPAGLYVAVLLRHETRSWPWFVLAALPANLIFDHLQGTPWAVSLGFCCANPVEGLTGAYLVRRFVAGKPELATLREFFGLLGGSALLSTMLGAAVGAFTLTISGLAQPFWQIWFTWCGNEAMAILLLTPFILVWSGETKPKERFLDQPGRLVEAALLAACLIGGTWYILVLGQGINAPNKALLLPALLWAGLRFGLRGATAAIVLFAVLMGFWTTHCLKGLTPAEIATGNYVATLQEFLVIAVVITLIPTIVIHERNRKVLELQESEERFRQLTQAAFEGICISENGRICDINDQGLQMFGCQREEMIGRLITDMVAPESRAQVAEAVQQNREVAYEHQLLRKDGSVFPAEARAKMVRVGNRAVRMTAVRDITARKQAEAALRESEERFACMFRNCPIPITLIRLGDGSFLDANDSFLRMSGFSPEEVRGRNALQLNVYPDPSRRAYILEEVRRHGRLHGHDQPFRTKSGQIRSHRLWIEVVVIGGEQCILVLALDITEQKRAEEISQNREAQYHSLFEHMLGGFILMEVICDPAGQPVDHRLLQANSGFDEMTGLERVEEIGRTSATLTFKWPPEVAQRYYQVALGAGPMLWERFNESLQRWYDVRVYSPQRGLFAMVFYDITARKQAETSHARLATVVQQTSESIVITDTEGIILYVNPAFERNSGYAYTEAVGQTSRLFKSDRHEPAYFRQMWAVIKRGEVWQGRFVNRRKDGSLYEEEAAISPMFDSTGKINNFVAVKRDVTREALLEAELRQAQKMEAIGQLAGGVAHDFNNILSALLMQTDMITMHGNLPKEAREGLQEIRADIRRASELTRQLLLVSRRQVMRVRQLDLNDLVTNLSKMLHRTIREDVRLQLRLRPSPLLIRADSGMLEQVLMNLALNARDAMPAGGELLIETSATTLEPGELALHPEAPAGIYARLSVGDTGTGIPPELLPRIFEPFFTTKEAGKGTGLGLATVFGIIRQHEGWIKVDNRPGAGATFHVYLPAGLAEEPPPAPVAERPKPRGGSETILFAEDEPALRKLTRRFLERHGYLVLEAADGREALNLWQAHRHEVSLLLTDLVMPGGINGQELALRLRAEKPGLKVVYISGYSAEIAGRDWLLLPGEAFLQKPFATEDILETVRRSLDAQAPAEK